MKLYIAKEHTLDSVLLPFPQLQYCYWGKNEKELVNYTSFKFKISKIEKVIF